MNKLAPLLKEGYVSQGISGLLSTSHFTVYTYTIPILYLAPLFFWGLQNKCKGGVSCCLQPSLRHNFLELFFNARWIMGLLSLPTKIFVFLQNKSPMSWSFSKVSISFLWVHTGCTVLLLAYWVSCWKDFLSTSLNYTLWLTYNFSFHSHLFNNSVIKQLYIDVLLNVR